MHSVVVNGYNDEYMIINDPNFDEKEYYIPFNDFINAWQLNDGIVVILKKIES
ncbi:hypothetical protein JXJ21_23935 [candidate division KSB1 bacterium]|nr:hypothetical protein [candidate division KSB1 bacterium]